MRVAFSVSRECVERTLLSAAFHFDLCWYLGLDSWIRVTLFSSRGLLPMANLDWSQCPAVESVPGKVSGAWVLKGTRMPVSAIFENLEAGANLDDIMGWYDGLDREQVKAVIEFAARSLDQAPA
jgi:uncharacterized protein (DUF433 family)